MKSFAVAQGVAGKIDAVATAGLPNIIASLLCVSRTLFWSSTTAQGTPSPPISAQRYTSPEETEPIMATPWLWA